MGNSIKSLLSITSLAAYLTISGDSALTLADERKPGGIETKVHINSAGLVSVVDENRLQHGLYKGLYRADGDFTISNGNKPISGELTLSYSLCFQDDRDPTRYGCIDGKQEVLPQGLPVGQWQRHFQLKQRFNSEAVAKTYVGKKPKLSINLKREDRTEVYDAAHILPKVGDYQCKNYCP